MNLPRSIQYKMFLSELKSSDFELTVDNFVRALDRGMKLFHITNRQLAKNVWTNEIEVQRWRGRVNVPLELTQINVLHTLEEMMEARISLTEWWEKMSSNFFKWCQAIGMVLGMFACTALYVLYIGICIMIHLPYLAFLPVFVGLVLAFRYLT